MIEKKIQSTVGNVGIKRNIQDLLLLLEHLIEFKEIIVPLVIPCVYGRRWKTTSKCMQMSRILKKYIKNRYDMAMTEALF